MIRYPQVATAHNKMMGTNRISEISDRYGAHATLGLILNGVLTAFFAGPITELLLS